jgi:prepilin-type N-terminal cleavage/methylation domain-containing protein
MNRHLGPSQEGFSLIEVVVALGLLVTLAGAAILIMPSAVRTARADAAVGAALNALRIGRERALVERRNFQVGFLGRNQIQIQRVEYPSLATTVVQNTYLEGGQEFLRFGSLPEPEAFGWTGAIAFGTTPTLTFTSEGTFVDSSGDVLNGTLYLGVPGDVMSARAITIFGATGLIRSWRWDGRQWVE